MCVNIPDTPIDPNHLSVAINDGQNVDHWSAADGGLDSYVHWRKPPSLEYEAPK